ncbi:MAG: DUF1295 domain-containing protein [Candidatus Aminicenantes bacterium]|nr:DUF1295 domain-containing protein [Candidatus Aminicenantes bacterium]
MESFLGYAALAIFVYMTLAFFTALALKDNSLADIFWGGGFGGVALLTFFLGPDFTSRQLLVLILVLVWGIRLAVYVALRNRGRGEDYRYAKWRKDWGRWFIPRSYLQVFLLQGFFMLIISAPIILVNHSNERGLCLLDLLGLAVWLTGFFFEAVGDFQLRKFKKDPSHKGKIINSGLWKFTRHPNYFGESCMWWGLFIIALSVKNGWMAVVSPLLITWLLLKVSGVAMLEKKYKDNAEFREYARKTSAFIPWFPKKA